VIMVIRIRFLNMHQRVKLSLIPFLLLPLASTHADTFGSGANTFTMDFVTIGNPGNAADTTGDPNPVGSVGYTYRMGVHEVSRGMIEAYNALGGGPTLPLIDMTDYNANGPDKPITSISWNGAARFVNWLNTSKGYSAAYKFTTGGANDNIVLWGSGDAGYNPANPFRNANAYYFLPSEDEWYKAAYYDPDANAGSGGYWDYATGSDTAPTAVAGGTSQSTAVYDLQTGPADVANAGGLSPYGTMAQNGNVWEWIESAHDGSNDSSVESRTARGSDFLYSDTSYLSASFRYYAIPPHEVAVLGFRVASVPEPSASLMSMLGMMGVAMRRKRG
jgi:formylglycine-generating enzyme required for sulfatase activity